MTEIETETKEQENIQLKHDGLFKKTMENPLAAQEFLDYYLPAEVKEVIDLSKLKPEKETFVEESLARRMSDVVYSAPTKDNEKAFIYCLIEHQSSNDNLLILRMWK